MEWPPRLVGSVRRGPPNCACRWTRPIGEKTAPGLRPEAVRVCSRYDPTYMPIALCASFMYFMHLALLPAFIAAFD